MEQKQKIPLYKKSDTVLGTGHVWLRRRDSPSSAKPEASQGAGLCFSTGRAHEGTEGTENPE